jgi:hypothetical protein
MDRAMDGNGQNGPAQWTEWTMDPNGRKWTTKDARKKEILYSSHKVKSC